MGVEGRDEGVGMELVVLVVPLVLMLLLPSVETDSRDRGLREGKTLCESAIGALLLADARVGDDVP